MQKADTLLLDRALHVVVDPRRTATARGAGLHLQPVPGTDLALALGLLHVVVQDGLVDEEYVAARTTGFEAVRATGARLKESSNTRVLNSIGATAVVACFVADGDQLPAASPACTSTVYAVDGVSPVNVTVPAAGDSITVHAPVGVAPV